MVTELGIPICEVGCRSEDSDTELTVVATRASLDDCKWDEDIAVIFSEDTTEVSLWISREDSTGTVDDQATRN